MAFPFLTGGFISRVNTHRSSSIGSNRSVGSVTSGHSADCIAGEDDDSSSVEGKRQPPPMVMGDTEACATQQETPKVGVYNSRPDVGSIGILSGNWGGGRSNATIAERVNNDVKKRFCVDSDVAGSATRAKGCFARTLG